MAEITSPAVGPATKEPQFDLTFSADFLASKGKWEELSAEIENGLAIDTVERNTGMSALHFAVGRNNLQIVKFLVEHGASFFADSMGRWPSTIAALCEVDEDLQDYITEAEARAEGV